MQDLLQDSEYRIQEGTGRIAGALSLPEKSGNRRTQKGYRE
jgi:hypothetical protein